MDEGTPQFDLEAHVSQERLNDVLAGAAPLMRAALLLRLRDDRRYKEIAQELGMTDRQVKRYLARGYAKLRQTLID